METQLLRTFVAVAEAGSISAAATSLGYVQSSASEQIARLERELGVALLTRTSTGVAPTAAGCELLADAERVLAAVDGLRRTAAARPRLRVGSVDTLAVRWLPAVIDAMPADQRPAITMDRRDVLLRTLTAGESDVAVLYRPVGAPLPDLGARTRSALARLEVEVLAVDELVVVAAPDRVGADDDDWLVTQPGCVHREVFDRHVAPGLGEGRIAAQASTPDALRQLARQGAGRAILPRLAVADDLVDGALAVDPGGLPDGGAMEIVAVHQPDAPPVVHRFLRRAVDRALAA